MQVTLFGSDSGAASILALQASEAARGLFRAIWLLGPSVTFNRTFEDLSQHNQAFFLARSGCQNATCLRHMSARDVVETYLWKDEPSFRIRDQNDLPIQGIYPEQLIVLDGKHFRTTNLRRLTCSFNLFTDERMVLKFTVCHRLTFLQICYSIFYILILL